MQPRIEFAKEKKLIGYHCRMSLTQNKTGELWGRFAPRIKEIRNRVSADKISMQIYPPGYHQQFNPETAFEKWATVEVRDFENIPADLETFVLKEGMYAIFDYKGSSADHSVFEYIYSQWLPQSNYVLDNRPHFEVLGPLYRNNDPNSEEEIWIPVREK